MLTIFISRRTLIILLCLLLQACSQTAVTEYSFAQLPSFIDSTEQITAYQALARIEETNLLLLNDEMRRFVDKHVDQSQPLRQQVHSLYLALRSPAFLGLEYYPNKTFTAEEAFQQEQANCLAFSSLFIAMARYAGIDAHYQLISKNPSWDKQGQWVRLNIHVNVIVPLPGDYHYIIDIDPQPVRHGDNQHFVADDTAVALYYNNLAIDALSQEDLAQAYSYLINAIKLAPEQELLWTNLGTILRKNNQPTEAAEVYDVALKINPNSNTALNNLSVLYSTIGDEDKANFYANKIRRHRNKNPYYHYQLSLQAQQLGDYEQAISHLKDAIKRKDSEVDFYYSMSEIYFSLEQYEKSLEWINKALKQSMPEQQRKTYQQQQKNINTFLSDNTAKIQ
jgi:tetratricopeptide (TPR) repeat protein